VTKSKSGGHSAQSSQTTISSLLKLISYQPSFLTNTWVANTANPPAIRSDGRMTLLVAGPVRDAKRRADRAAVITSFCERLLP